MQSRISVITLAVEDLERAVVFYRDGLGLATEGIIGKKYENGAVAFFDLNPGLKLALWPRASLAHETGLPIGQPNPTDLMIAHNVATKPEVDELMAQAKQAGAVIIKAPHEVFYGGYAGYFKDPDAHLWEVVWNPKWSLD